MSHSQWVSEIFGRAADLYGEEGNPFFNHFGAELVSRADVKPGAQVLDVATGKGAVLFPLAKAVGPEGAVTGIDLSREMVEATQARLDTMAEKSWVNLRQMDVSHLDFPEASFDHVFCGFALFFFPQLKEVIAEFCRVLKPGGTLVVSIWGKNENLSTWAMQEAYKLGATKDLDAVNLHEASTLRQYLEEGALKCQEIVEASETFWHPSSEIWWEGLWGHGVRGVLEQLPVADLLDLKERALQKAEQSREPKGISELYHAVYGIAKKS